jgi:hypothetical protein
MTKCSNYFKVGRDLIWAQEDESSGLKNNYVAANFGTAMT